MGKHSRSKQKQLKIKAKFKGFRVKEVKSKQYFQMIKFLIWVKIDQEIIELQNSININNLKYSSTKYNYKVSNYLLPMVFSKDTYERWLSINTADEKQGLFYNEIKRAIHGRTPQIEGKKFFILLKVIYFQWKLWLTTLVEYVINHIEIPIKKTNSRKRTKNINS